MSLFGDEGGWGLPSVGPSVLNPITTTIGNISGIPGLGNGLDINNVLGRLGGASIGGIIGGPVGSAAGAIDPRIWERLVDKMGGGKKDRVTYGSDMATPTLDPLVSAVNPISGRLDASGLEAYKARALGQGESPWAAMMKQKQGLEQRDLMNQAAQNSATQAATARANLAMHGGLRGGAMERLSGAAGNDLALARQNVLNQGALQRANIGVQDEAIKNQFLQGLPGQQLSAAGYQTGVDQFNAAQQAADAAARNQYNLTKYGEQMKMKGAGMSAQAIENAGKK